MLFLRVSGKGHTMFEVQGKYASAKIFAEIAEESAVAQIITLCNQPVSEGAKIRIIYNFKAGNEE